MVSHTYACFGVVVTIKTDGSLTRDDVEASLPPGAAPAREAPQLTVSVTGGDDLVVVSTHGPARTAKSREHAQEIIEHEVSEYVSVAAPRHIFFHTGVVRAPHGALVCFPGRSWSGKSELTRALLLRGYAYYSDEYAVADRDGLVQPYQRRLAFRVHVNGPDQPPTRVRVDPATFGVPDQVPPPAVVGLIVNVPFRPERAQSLTVGSKGQAALHLVDNALPARTRPTEVLRCAATIARNATFWHGTRHDSEWLVDQIDQWSSEALPVCRTGSSQDKL